MLFKQLLLKSQFSVFRDLKLRWLFLLFLLFMGLAGLSNYAYYRDTSSEVDLSDFVNELHKREGEASSFLASVAERVQAKGVLELSHDERIFKFSEDNNLNVFITKGDSLCFWSSNAVDIRSGGDIPVAAPVFFTLTHNSYCVGVQTNVDDCRIAVLFKFRQKRLLGVRHFINSLPGLNLPSEAQVVDKSTHGAIDILSKDGQYLFSVKATPIHKLCTPYLVLTVLFSLLSFLSLIILNYVLGSLAIEGKVPRTFALLFAGLSLFLVALFTSIRWPESLFANAFFSSEHYCFGFAKSLGHLVVYTIILFWLYLVIRKFYTPISLIVRLNEKLPKHLGLFVSQVLASVFFCVAYVMTINLVYHSSMDVATSHVQEISVVTIIALFLVIPWFAFSLYVATSCAKAYVVKGIRWIDLALSRLVVTFLGGLFIVLVDPNWVHMLAWVLFLLVELIIEAYYFFDYRKPWVFLAVLSFLAINITVAICYMHCMQRNDEHYTHLAQKMTDNVALVANPEDEVVLRENGVLIARDHTLFRLMDDSSEARFENVSRYLLDYFLDGFANKYEIDVQIHRQFEPFMVRKGFYENSLSCYSSFLTSDCKLIEGSNNFYISKRADLPLAYIGVFPCRQDVVYVFLYPSLSVYRQDQDAELLTPSNIISATPDFSVAKYYNSDLLFVSGSYHYPNTSTWIPKHRKENFHIYKNDCTHYISRFDDNTGYVVITKMERRSYTYFIFVSYLCAFFVLILLSYGVFWWLLRRRRQAQSSILTRMQFWLLGPLLFAFIILGVCSLYFFMSQYQQKAVNNMNEQASSIQLNLQQKIGFSKSLKNVDYQRLSQDLKDLSNLFRTDIVLYDKDGRQIVSSRSTYLNKGRRFNRLMYPVPHFMHYTDYFREARFGNADFFSFYTYLYNQRNQIIGYVNIRSSTGAEQMRNEVFNLLVVLIDVYLVIVLLTIVISWLVSRRVIKPVEMLSDQFKQIKLTGANTKVEYNANDELGSLVLQYNVMVDKLQLSAEQLAQSQRELAWRDMARRIAHEIKNPLTPMKLSVQMAQMKQQRDPENFPEYFERTSALLIEQIDNLSRIASEFSTFAKTTVTVREEVDLSNKVRSVVDLFVNNPEGVKFELDMHGVESAMVWSDNKQILQVFNNLFKNAIQAIPEGKDGVVRVDFQKNEDACVVSITDNGCGIPEENLETIFEPNFTTKTSGNGLGLAIVKNIVGMANGEIWVDSKVGEGTTFFIRIPLIKPGEKADDLS